MGNSLTRAVEEVLQAVREKLARDLERDIAIQPIEREAHLNIFILLCLMILGMCLLGWLQDYCRGNRARRYDENHVD